MNEVLQFLTENPTFYLATVDGDLPKVRPFGFVMDFEGKLCFCTSNQKDVEICTASKTGQWLRLKGNAVFNTSKQSQQAALDAAPFLKNMYSVDDSIFEIFYIDHAQATISDMTGASKTIQF